MLKFLLSSVVVFVIVSCGVKEEAAPKMGVTYIDSSHGEPILLEKRQQEFKCPSLLTNDQDLDIISEFHTSWRYTVIPFKIPVKFRSGIVSNSLLSSVTFGGKVAYNESYIKNTFTSKELLKSENFKVCPGVDYSEENNFDSASASAVFAFQQAEKEMKNVNLNLPPVKLRIAPIVKHTQEWGHNKRIIKRERTLVNNAFYHKAKAEVVFLPQGKNSEGKIPFSEVPLWKIPFVGVHEYGHHLFANLMRNYFDEKHLSGAKHMSLCFNNKEHSHPHIHSVTGVQKDTSRQVSVHDVMGALNEGVSDLLARVVLDQKFNLTGVGCFEYTRDVQVKMLANGEQKQINEDVIKSFLSSDKVEVESCYGDQDYQDPHIIGAIIAHGIHRLFEQVTLTKTQRLKLIVSWLKEVNFEFLKLKDENHKDTLEKIIEIGIKTVLSNHSIPKDQSCITINTVFPTVKDRFNCK